MQCTVTRPGVSAIAAALAVELAVTCLQHPDRGEAPCCTNSGGGNKSSDAGYLDFLLRLLSHNVKDQHLAELTFMKLLFDYHHIL